MKRQPRNPKTDKLVNERLISMAYGQIGKLLCFLWHQFELGGSRVVHSLESVTALLILVGLRFGVCKPEPQAVKNLQ